MGYVAKLTRGRDTLDLSSGRYSLGLDYKPGVSSFSIKVSGSSSAEIRKGIDDLNLFLTYCGDPANPTRFWWNPDNNVSAAPVWGQRERSVEVLSGYVEYWDAYFEADVRSTTAFVKVSFSFGSVAEGAKQLAATATGGIVEDWIGVADGQSRGLQIPEGDATNGNKMTNPVFGHPTWNTGWTAGTCLTATQNTNPEYIIYGINSGRLSSSAGSANTYTLSINAGTAQTHTLSCYAKLPDGGTIGTAHMQVYCGSALTTTYQSVGDGWYRCWGTVLGGTAAVTTGVLVKQNYIVYTDAFQLEQQVYPTAFFYGDIAGCAWTGTAHASKSTRTASKLTLPTTGLNLNEGSIRVTWTPDRNADIGGATKVIFQSNTGGLTLQYVLPGAKWNLYASAGAWNFQSAVDNFAAFIPITFHVVWGNNGVHVYKNGVSIINDTFSIIANPTTFYIGSSSITTDHSNGVYSNFLLWEGEQLSAAEVLADYANISNIIADSQGLGGIPYVWTKDGDDTVDNVDSGANENIAVIGGIPGDLPAKVDAKLTVGGMAAADLYLGRLDWKYGEYIDPDFLTNAMLGTVALTTADNTITYIPFDDDEFRLIEGRKISVMMRAVEGTAAGLNNINLRTGISPGGAYYYTSYLASSWGTAGTTTIDSSPEIYFVQDEEFYRTLGITRAGSVFIGAKRASGSADLIVHSVGILPSPTTRFTNLSAGTVSPVILYTNGKAYEATGTSLAYGYQVTGAALELMPNRYNVLVSYLGREGVTSAATNTLAYSSVYITPRWRMA